MGRIELLQPFLEGGIRNTNFFNGRLLSAEDLRQEQTANRERDAQLARAVGAGVVEGLEVERLKGAGSGGGLTNAVVNVRAGLALNENGQALALAKDTEVALVRELEAVNAEAGLFATCAPPQQTAVVSGAGLYLLVVTPASGYEQRAPVSGLGSTGLTSPGCGSRYAVEGVQFKLVGVDINTLAGIPTATRNELNTLMSTGGAANLSLLQNLMAYLCFGAAQTASFARDPFAPANRPDATPAPNVLEALRAEGELTGCDVPLALVYWTASAGLDFVDMWSARRRVTHASVTDEWGAPGGERERALREAMAMQFQAHLEGLRATAQSAQQVVAEKYFRYLPPAGFIPLGGVSGLVGFTYQSLFQNMTYREPVFINGARLAALLHEARSYPPIDARSDEMFWLYLVRENQQAYNQGGNNRPQPYLVFAKGHLPYQGNAQYDLAYWNYSNYALI